MKLLSTHLIILTVFFAVILGLRFIVMRSKTKKADHSLLRND